MPNFHDYVSVPNATEFPNSCVCCTLTAGPLVRVREHPHLGIIYVCAECYTKLGRALGHIKGPQRQLLLDNSRQLAQRETEIASLTEELNVQRARADEFSAKWETADAALRDFQQRIEQLEYVIRSEAQAKLAVVGPGHDAA